MESNNHSNEYIQNMKNSSVWGGGIELRVVCELYNVDVIVKRGNQIVAHFEKDCNERLIELHWTGSHYTPISISTVN